MYFLLMVSVICLLLNSIGTKLNKAKGLGKLLSVTLLAGAAGIVAWGTCLIAGNRVTADMLPFASIFGVLFIACSVCLYRAYEKGPLAGTSLFSNSSLVIMVLFSATYFQEALGVKSVIGLIGVLASLTLLSLPQEKGKEEKKANLLWVGLCFSVMFFNSILSISTKLRQVKANGENPFAYMALCYTIAFVVGVVVYALFQLKKKTFPEDFEGVRNNITAIGMQTLGNAGSNMLVTFLSSRLDGSILYPVNSGGGLILTVLCGFLFFNEKKTWKNIIGISLGIAAIVLLSI